MLVDEFLYSHHIYCRGKNFGIVGSSTVVDVIRGYVLIKIEKLRIGSRTVMSKYLLEFYFCGSHHHCAIKKQKNLGLPW